jgi:disulfide bond formation protein DsbB
MDTDTWFTFFALLAVAAQVATVVVVGTALARTSGAADAWARLRDSLGESGIAIAAIVALTATIGSLYLSEGADLVPCKLCWYQRIAMYSLAVLLVIAALRRDWGIRPYALTLAGIGAGISTYHYLLERFPEWESSVTCEVFNPCNQTLIWRFHYVSIPLMALSGFALVGAVLAAARPDTSRGSGGRDDEVPVPTQESR